MERPLKGDVVVINFPFSDFTSSKRRPCFVAANAGKNDSILCQITSHKTNDSLAIHLNEMDFVVGSLKLKSNIRPNKIFTADNSIILYKAGSLKKQKTKEVIESICTMLKE